MHPGEGTPLKTKARRLLRAVTKNRQLALAAIFAPVMVLIVALASAMTNAAASASPATGSGATSLLGPAAVSSIPVSSIPATQTITETDSVTPTVTITETESVTPTVTTTETVSDTPTVTTTETVSDTPTVTTTETVSDTPTVTTTGSYSMKPTPTPTPKCVANSKSISYYKDVKGGIEVVVGGHNLWLCHPVYALSVGWTYEKTTSMWPQDDPFAGKLVVITGSGTYFIPAGVGCEVDFYASVGKPPAYPKVLTAPGKPYEPKFLNAYFSGTNAVMFYITPAQCQCGKERASL